MEEGLGPYICTSVGGGEGLGQQGFKGPCEDQGGLRSGYCLSVVRQMETCSIMGSNCLS